MAAPTQPGKPSEQASESAQRHPTVQVTVNGTSAPIDEAIAPLIEGLWQLGIRTRASCQDRVYRLNLMRNERHGFYIMFADTEDLRRMMTLFVDGLLDPRRHGTGWQYQLFPRFDDVPTAPGDPVVGLHPVVVIPIEHLDFVTSTVCAAATGLRSNHMAGRGTAPR